MKYECKNARYTKSFHTAKEYTYSETFYAHGLTDFIEELT